MARACTLQHTAQRAMLVWPHNCAYVQTGGQQMAVDAPTSSSVHKVCMLPLSNGHHHMLSLRHLSWLHLFFSRDGATEVVQRWYRAEHPTGRGDRGTACMHGVLAAWMHGLHAMFVSMAMLACNCMVLQTAPPPTHRLCTLPPPSKLRRQHLGPASPSAQPPQRCCWAHNKIYCGRVWACTHCCCMSKHQRW